jgi:glyoxylase-like metal-dependent hydrolase (beta-lactamase superfamily II)
VWQVALPFDNPLGYSFAYIVSTDDGPILVDAGAPQETARTALWQALDELRFDPRSIVGVLLTHGHFDHCGLVSEIVGSSCAWVGLHRNDWPLLEGGRRTIAEGELAWLRANDVPQRVVAQIRDDLLGLPTLRFAGGLRGLEDGATVEVGGRRFDVVATPGHSPGHLSFVLADAGVVFTGDHVLPRITPLVGLWSDGRTNPLGDYLQGIARLALTGADTALPGHEWSFGELPSRLRELEAHHEERLEEVDAHARRSASLWDLARALPWARPWDRLEPMGWYCALGEVASHLRELTTRGRLSSELEQHLILRSA